MLCVVRFRTTPCISILVSPHDRGSFNNHMNIGITFLDLYVLSGETAPIRTGAVVTGVARFIGNYFGKMLKQKSAQFIEEQNNKKINKCKIVCFYDALSLISFSSFSTIF